MRNIVNILTADIAAEVRNRVQAGAKDIAVLMAATLLLVCSFVVVMFALYMFLTLYMEPVYAALIIGALFFLAGVILLQAIRKNGPPSERQKAEEDQRPSGRDAYSDIEAEAMRYVRRHSKQATIMSLLAGVAVGASPELRRTLLHALDAALAERQGRSSQDSDPRR